LSDKESLGDVSVVIPAYNAQAVIGRAVESVLSQTIPPSEILVIDDGSTDCTGRAVAQYGDKVRYIRQDNAGASAARNRGIQEARGWWIAFLDADDQWLPNRLQRQAELLTRHTDLRWITGNFYRCDCGREHRQRFDITPQQQNCIRKTLQGGEVFDSYFAAHRLGAMGWTGTMLIRKGLLEEAGLFLPGQKRINDVDLWLRMAYQGARIGYVFEPLAIYHMGTAGSILKAHRQAEHIDQFLQRHFRLAEQAGMAEQFRPCAAQMLGWWVGQRMAEGDGRQMRFLLKKYRYLFSKNSYTKQYILSWCPKTGALYNRVKKSVRTYIQEKKAGP
jgi:glycosyltransferase involved in cell wall biosynthesis